MPPRSLIEQGHKRLQKASDAYTDPAIIPAAPAPVPHPAEPADDSKDASKSAGEKEIIKTSDKDSKIARPKDSKTAVSDASSTPALPPAEMPAPRPARRRGRPRGPQRVALSVRIRAELDARLTAAVETAEMGPQEIVEEALAAWLDRHERRQRAH